MIFIYRPKIQSKHTKERIKLEKFRADLILNYGKHLLPGPAEKFKKPLLKYHPFITYGTRIDSNCCILIEQSTMDRIIRYVPKKLQSFSSQYVQNLIEEIIDVSGHFHVVLIFKWIFSYLTQISKMCTWLFIFIFRI